MISEDEERLNKLLIDSIFKYGMEFDEALSLIDRLIFSVKEKVALSIVSNIIMELINHQNEN